MTRIRLAFVISIAFYAIISSDRIELRAGSDATSARWWRCEDVPALARHFLANLCTAANVPLKVTSKQAIHLIAALPWRGNLREFENFLRGLVAKVPGQTIRLAADIFQGCQFSPFTNFRLWNVLLFC